MPFIPNEEDVQAELELLEAERDCYLAAFVQAGKTAPEPPAPTMTPFGRDTVEDVDKNRAYVTQLRALASLNSVKPFENVSAARKFLAAHKATASTAKAGSASTAPKSTAPKSTDTKPSTKADAEKLASLQLAAGSLETILMLDNVQRPQRPSVNLSDLGGSVNALEKHVAALRVLKSNADAVAAAKQPKASAKAPADSQKPAQVTPDEASRMNATDRAKAVLAGRTLPPKTISSTSATARCLAARKAKNP